MPDKRGKKSIMFKETHVYRPPEGLRRKKGQQEEVTFVQRTNEKRN